MKELLIVDLAFNDIFTTCKEGETTNAIKRAKTFYKSDLDLVRSHKENYPQDAEYWQTQIDKYSKILSAGFEAITFEEFEKRQRERWLNKPIKEVTGKEYDDMLCVLPPIEWYDNDKYSIFMVGECYTMTYYSQYLYNKENKKYYSALVDRFDKETWIDKRLGLV